MRLRNFRCYALCLCALAVAHVITRNFGGLGGIILHGGGNGGAAQSTPPPDQLDALMSELARIAPKAATAARHEVAEQRRRRQERRDEGGDVPPQEVGAEGGEAGDADTVDTAANVAAPREPPSPRDGVDAPGATAIAPDTTAAPASPSATPTASPTATPTATPKKVSMAPSGAPTKAPSGAPTKVKAARARVSSAPSRAPTVAPRKKEKRRPRPADNGKRKGGSSSSSASSNGGGGAVCKEDANATAGGGRAAAAVALRRRATADVAASLAAYAVRNFKAYGGEAALRAAGAGRQYTRHGGVACLGMNELGMFKSGHTILTCREKCNAKGNKCVSFEFLRAVGGCNLSSSCTLKKKPTQNDKADLYIKVKGHRATAEAGIPQWYQDVTAPGAPPIDALPDRCGFRCRTGDKAADRQHDAALFLLHRWFIKWPRAATSREAAAAAKAAKRAAARDASKQRMAAMKADHPEHRTIVARHGTDATKKKLTSKGEWEEKAAAAKTAASSVNATAAKTSGRRLQMIRVGVGRGSLPEAAAAAAAKGAAWSNETAEGLADTGTRDRSRLVRRLLADKPSDTSAWPPGLCAPWHNTTVGAQRAIAACAPPSSHAAPANKGKIDASATLGLAAYFSGCGSDWRQAFVAELEGAGIKVDRFDGAEHPCAARVGADELSRRAAAAGKRKFCLTLDDRDRAGAGARLAAAWTHGCVPVHGGSFDAEAVAPGPHSFVDTRNFASSATAVAKHLQHLDRNRTAYLKYFAWKKKGASDAFVRFAARHACSVASAGGAEAKGADGGSTSCSACEKRNGTRRVWKRHTPSDPPVGWHPWCQKNMKPMKRVSKYVDKHNIKQILRKDFPEVPFAKLYWPALSFFSRVCAHAHMQFILLCDRSLTLRPHPFYFIYFVFEGT